MSKNSNTPIRPGHEWQIGGGLATTGVRSDGLLGLDFTTDGAGGLCLDGLFAVHARMLDVASVAGDVLDTRLCINCPFVHEAKSRVARAAPYPTIGSTFATEDVDW